MMYTFYFLFFNLNIYRFGINLSSLLLAVSSFLSLFDFVVYSCFFIVTFCLSVLNSMPFCFYLRLIMFGLMGFENCFRNKTIMFE